MDMYIVVHEHVHIQIVVVMDIRGGGMDMYIVLNYVGIDTSKYCSD